MCSFKIQTDIKKRKKKLILEDNSKKKVKGKGTLTSERWNVHCAAAVQWLMRFAGKEVSKDGSSSDSMCQHKGLGSCYILMYWSGQ